MLEGNHKYKKTKNSCIFFEKINVIMNNLRKNVIALALQLLVLDIPLSC